jgi:hypothetical protein
MRLKRRRWAIGCGIPLGLLAIGAVVLPDQRNAILTAFHLYRDGAFNQKQVEYDVKSREDTLKGIYRMLKDYNESEGQLPDAGNWMEKMSKRVKTADLKDNEGIKKLIRPDLIGQDGKYGYALNAAASDKYLGDLKDPKMILVYESKQTKWNAVGDPATDRSGIGITISGEIVR